MISKTKEVVRHLFNCVDRLDILRMIFLTMCTTTIIYLMSSFFPAFICFFSLMLSFIGGLVLGRLAEVREINEFMRKMDKGGAAND